MKKIIVPESVQYINSFGFDDSVVNCQSIIFENPDYDFEKNPEHTVPGSAKNIFKKLCLSLRP